MTDMTATLPASPLEATRRELAAALAGLGAGVVTLGVHDALGPRTADPFARARPAATVHLSGRAVLIGVVQGHGHVRALHARLVQIAARGVVGALDTAAP
ncbi:hypothetical protein ACWDA9_29540, partial [Streptomyces sp. NPDC001193]